jgi:exopolyphosphatase/pppGpp-phosphohydrolase
MINRHILTADTIERIFHELEHLTLDQLRSYPQIHPLRTDIVLAGIMILREILKTLNYSQITVSDRGLRYGILMKTAQSMLGSMK